MASLSGWDNWDQGPVQRRIFVAEQDTVSDDHPISINVELIQSRVSAWETANVQVTLTYEGPSRGLLIHDQGCDIFNRRHGRSVQPEGLWLHSSTAHIKRKPGKWTRDRDPDEPRSFLLYGCSPVRYESGDSLQSEYAVWDDYRVEGYMKPETYRFERDITLYTKEQDEWKSNSTITWGFSLTVEEP